MAGEVDVNTINDIDMLMIALIAGSNKGFKTAAEAYKLIPPGSNEMLGWKRPIEIQPLMLFDLLRVGTVGDGNCLLHSILFACSPTYRAQDARSRSALADAFRRVLCARDFELIEIADSIYGPEIGGAAALEEDFMDLHKKRDEMDVMMAPVIAHLFGHNLLAIQLREGMEMVPVRTTASGYDRTLPTILVNYLGGGLDFGNAAFADEGAGVFHYETIIGGEGKPEKTGKAKNTTIKKAKNTVKNTTKTKAKRTTGIILNDMTTQFVFNFGDPSLESIKELFGL
jgi:hypothetical protein